MVELDFQEVFRSYGEIYNHILSIIYPAKKNTGFPERNLSVNFSKAYEQVMEKKNHDVISWFEFQFGEDDRYHVDLVLLDNTTKELFIVESKRFSNPNKKMEEIGQDINRIYSFKNELQEEQKIQEEKKSQEKQIRINMKEIKHIYGVILADVWLETPLKREIYGSYQNRSFVSDYINKMSNDVKKLDESYYCLDVVGKYNWIKNYKLVSFVWELTDKS